MNGPTRLASATGNRWHGMCLDASALLVITISTVTCALQRRAAEGLA